MTSILKVDSIQTAAGNPFDFGGNNILEAFTVVCNGESVTVGSGTYTPTNVTAIQALTDSHVVVNGSSIAYTPPTSATEVIYKFNFFISSTSAISHYAMRIDGTQITGSRTNYGSTGPYDLRGINFEWRIPIGGTASNTTGRVASWTSAKTIDVTMRRYNSTYPGDLHKGRYWDGAGDTNIIVQPTLSITALK
jgi:hypothetical protein